MSSEAVDPRFRATVAKEGRLPRAPDEAAIDAHTAGRKGVRVGATIFLQGETAKAPFKVVGFTQIKGVESFGGTTVVDVQLPVAQRIVGHPRALRLDPGGREARHVRRRAQRAAQAGAPAVGDRAHRASSRRPSSRATSATTSAS